uniref:Uncharacterized protein n=1 Tax=Mus spicilegus TaxID=10103 RepID=A0A8C6HFY4_MUSSI
RYKFLTWILVVQAFNPRTLTSRCVASLVAVHCSTVNTLGKQLLPKTFGQSNVNVTQQVVIGTPHSPAASNTIVVGIPHSPNTHFVSQNQTSDSSPWSAGRLSASDLSNGADGMLAISSMGLSTEAPGLRALCPTLGRMMTTMTVTLMSL